ncbi:MAG TPA: helix-turn-helix domain-containing protein [Candidatus Omnitrophota bacterium]|nr:helix-turn-helix domain-containing protein [Candidatus Omnitrophota bacterium]
MMELMEMPMEEARRITRHRMLKEYGASLLQRRKERGITKIELFERTGVSISDISKAELGLFELSEEQKLRISKFLRRQRII